MPSEIGAMQISLDALGMTLFAGQATSTGGRRYRFLVDANGEEVFGVLLVATSHATQGVDGGGASGGRQEIRPAPAA